ncbi:MAG: lysophospholipid acyltransferase family protein [Candidatus Omnitrophica bacterium]|nr:lysophospholipid acyltransferase family protein [Candidatus Omnitrophota bacterium]
MSPYRWYQAGSWLATRLPRPAAYGLASCLAAARYRFARRDRQAVARNLEAVLGPQHPRREAIRRAVFRNFAKYLVDFFRLGEVDEAFLRRRVTIVGREHLDAALRHGRGAILVSAHLGNYELGAAITAALGYPVNVVVLTHQDPRVDAFFTRQRAGQRVRPIAVGMALRQVFAALRRNELVGMLADRDFFNNGLGLTFLGREMSVPQGPALFGLRTGAPIVPAFLTREPGDRFQFAFERPMAPVPGADEGREVPRLTAAILAVVESYVRRYPDQWYLFRDFWDPGPWVIL